MARELPCVGQSVTDLHQITKLPGLKHRKCSEAVTDVTGHKSGGVVLDVNRSKHHGHVAIKTLVIVNTALRLAG